MLNKPYPLIESAGTAIKVCFMVGVFIFLFLLIFQPFGLSTAPVNIFIVTAVYGLIAFLISCSFALLITRIFNESEWTILHQIIFYLLLMIAIALANFYYTKTYNPLIGWHPLSFVFYTTVVGLFPIIFIIFFHQNRLFNKYKLASSEVNNALKKPRPNKESIVDEFNAKTMKGSLIKINQNNILFIESVGNYLLIHHVENNAVQQAKIRGTLKTLSKKLNPILQTTHRAFIVNTIYIVSAMGNAQGLKLKLAHTQNEIPVSRNYVSYFRRYLEK